MRGLVATALALAACADPEPPTFAEVQEETLTRSCGFSACHGAGAGYLTIDGTAADHGRLVDVASFASPDEILIVPGDPDASYVMKKIRGEAGIVGDEMPPGGGLSDAQIANLEAWIAAGALP